MAIVLRSKKGSELTYEELDGNFSELDTKIGRVDTIIRNLTFSFSNLADVPTTIEGYGITDAFSGSYNDLTDKPVLFSGSYNDLTDKPVAFSGSYNDLTDKPVAFSGSYNDLTDKPVLFSGSYNDLTDTPTIPLDVSELSDNTNLFFSKDYNDLTNTPSIPLAINDLTDVDVTSATNGQVLKYNGTNWVAENESSGGGDFSSLSVTVESPGTANLAYNTTTGVFTYTPPDLSSFLTSYTETNDLTSAVTWANVPDTNITQSSVTQHQAALSITESQISDLQSYLTSVSLNDLTDVDIASVSDGQVLKYNSSTSQWIAAADNASSGGDFSSLSVTTNTAGTAALSYNNSTGEFTYTPPDLTPYLLSTNAFDGDYNNLSNKPTIPTALTDLSITDGTNGQVLSTDGSGNFSFVDQAQASSETLATVTARGSTTSTPVLLTGGGELTDGENGITVDASTGNVTIESTGLLNITGNFVTVGGGTTNNITIGNGTNTIDLASGSTVDFTGTSITGLTAAPSRTDVIVTTASINDNVTTNVNVTGFKGYMLMAIETSAAAWVRLYTDSASRTADSSRTQTEDPLPDSGVIAEVITSGAEVVKISPGVLGFNFESPVTNNIPVKVTNLSGGTTSITITLTVLQMES